MTPLKNQRHEKFALLVAKGESATAAYKEVYGGSEKSAEAHGSRLVRNGKVKERIAAIQTAAAKKVEWSIAERLDFFREAALTPPNNITLTSRICQGLRVTKFGDYLLLPDKLKAAVEYGRLAGDYKEKVEITGDGLLALLEAVRGGNE